VPQKKDFYRAASCSILVLILLSGLFLISQTQATDSTNTYSIPVKPQSQNKLTIQSLIQSSPKGSLRNTNNPAICSTSPSNNVIYAVIRNDSNAYSSVKYGYGVHLDSWGIYYEMDTDHINILVNPATYDIQCSRILPQISWVASP
jgi:hypothetical protein